MSETIGKRLTHRAAIIKLLRQVRRTLHYIEIAQKLIKRGWVRSSGRKATLGVATALSRGLRVKDGDFFRAAKGMYGLRAWLHAPLRRVIRRRMREQGFILASDGNLLLTNEPSKDVIRSYHRCARRQKLKENKRFVNACGGNLIRYFADGSDIDISAFRPRIVEVRGGTVEADLFRFATLLWSAPVSHGFGRRLRFLVLDESNGKLVGLFALTDPVFNLKPRDQLIGWDHRQRERRLYNVMDIFVLGAVPPYNDLLCGKLIALLAATNEIHEAVRRKYAFRVTVIQRKRKDPRLVLLTTSSALGRSSLYNRIGMGGRIIYQRVGVTHGWGHFHFADGTFAAMRQYLRRIGDPVADAHEYGQGPNWRIRVARTCLEHIGMRQDLLKHGIQRELYMVPLARNFKEFLLGQHKEPSYYDMPTDEIVDYFKERWMRPRAMRYPAYRDHTRRAVVDSIRSPMERSSYSRAICSQVPLVPV